ncbi:MAG TPA: RHS repeat-associated core domain-containing protein [Terriglobales bacterium]|nr:RHS repeat-associated core domain-containing protein [Terriglobales bacterium]
MGGVRWGWLYQNGDGRFTLPDALGSTAVLAQDGTVQASRLYPFGEEAQATGAEYKWTNQIRDANALDHFAFRTYSSNLARWLSPDPAGLAAVDPADPQSWDRYSYVANRPLAATDPLGLMCSAGQCSSMKGEILSALSNTVGTLETQDACSINGVVGGCDTAEALVASGAGVQCPDNFCDPGGRTPFRCEGNVCGYMSLQYVATHENEWNGVLYTDAEFAELESRAVDAQRHALADAIADETGQSPSAVYLELDFDYTKGGNANFEFHGNLPPCFAGCQGGGEGAPCRFPANPSIHWATTVQGVKIVHLDAGDPFSGFVGFILHIGDLFGMINSSVPFGTGPH